MSLDQKKLCIVCYEMGCILLLVDSGLDVSDFLCLILKASKIPWLLGVRIKNKEEVGDI